MEPRPGHLRGAGGGGLGPRAHPGCGRRLPLGPGRGRGGAVHHRRLHLRRPAGRPVDRAPRSLGGARDNRVVRSGGGRAAQPLPSPAGCGRHVHPVLALLVPGVPCPPASGAGDGRPCRSGDRGHPERVRRDRRPHHPGDGQERDRGGRGHDLPPAGGRVRARRHGERAPARAAGGRAPALGASRRGRRGRGCRARPGPRHRCGGPNAPGVASSGRGPGLPQDRADHDHLPGLHGPHGHGPRPPGDGPGRSQSLPR